jgi:hypothetical protein
MKSTSQRRKLLRLLAGSLIVGGALLLASFVFEARILPFASAPSLILGGSAVVLGIWLAKLSSSGGSFYLCNSVTLDAAALAALGGPAGAPGVVFLSEAQINQARRAGARIEVVSGPYDSYQDAEDDLEKHWEFSHEQRELEDLMETSERSEDSK